MLFQIYLLQSEQTCTRGLSRVIIKTYFVSVEYSNVSNRYPNIIACFMDLYKLKYVRVQMIFGRKNTSIKAMNPGSGLKRATVPWEKVGL